MTTPLQLLNDDLTESLIFKAYDEVIEPVITDFFAKIAGSYPELNGTPEQQPNLEVYDVSDGFPFFEPTEENLFAIVIPVDYSNEFQLKIFDELALTDVSKGIMDQINQALLNDGNDDKFTFCECFLNTQHRTYILFSICTG